MNKKDVCANPCAKGKAGDCSGACAVDFLGFDAGLRSARAKIGGKPSLPATGPEDKEPAS